MRFLYLLLGLLISFNLHIRYFNDLMVKQEKFHEEYMLWVFVQGYYSGYKAGNDAGFWRKYYIIGACLEELDQNRMALMNCQAANPPQPDWSWK